MGITREEFMEALAGASNAVRKEEDRFRRTLDSDGTIISNCNQCLEVVGKSRIENEVNVAEQMHPCYVTVGE